MTLMAVSQNKSDPSHEIKREWKETAQTNSAQGHLQSRQVVPITSTILEENESSLERNSLPEERGLGHKIKNCSRNSLYKTGEKTKMQE